MSGMDDIPDSMIWSLTYRPAPGYDEPDEPRRMISEVGRAEVLTALGEGAEFTDATVGLEGLWVKYDDVAELLERVTK